MVSHLRRHPAGGGALQVGVMNFAERDLLGSLAVASVAMDKTKTGGISAGFSKNPHSLSPPGGRMLPL